MTTRLRMERAEDLLAEGNTPKRTRALLAAEYGISTRHAGRIVRRVFDQWEIESRADREAKRAQVRQRLQYLFRRAMTRQGCAVVQSTGEALYYDNPDIGGGAKVVELECRLDGLLEQPETQRNVIISGTDLRDVVAALYGIEPPAIEAEATVIDARQDGDE